MTEITRPRDLRLSSEPAHAFPQSPFRPYTSRIACIIATLNEADTIAEVVQKARPYVHHVVVVDGFSEDATCARARDAGCDVMYQEGTGKGMALRTAFHRIEADIYVTIDGDATYDAEEMDALIQTGPRWRSRYGDWIPPDGPDGARAPSPA